MAVWMTVSGEVLSSDSGEVLVVEGADEVTVIRTKLPFPSLVIQTRCTKTKGKKWQKKFTNSSSQDSKWGKGKEILLITIVPPRFHWKRFPRPNLKRMRTRIGHFHIFKYFRKYFLKIFLKDWYQTYFYFHFLFLVKMKIENSKPNTTLVSTNAEAYSRNGPPHRVKGLKPIS